MKKVAIEHAEPVKKIVDLIEKVIARRRLDKAFHRDEVEKVFMYLLQGKDSLDAYERRDAGVADPEWQSAVQSLKNFLNLEKKNGKDNLLFT